MELGCLKVEFQKRVAGGISFRCKPIFHLRLSVRQQRLACLWECGRCWFRDGGSFGRGSVQLAGWLDPRRRCPRLQAEPIVDAGRELSQGFGTGNLFHPLR